VTPAAWPRPDALDGRLLRVDPESGELSDLSMRDLPAILAPGDVLVVNDAATLPASHRVVSSSGDELEVRLAGRRADGSFRAVLLGSGDWRSLTTERPAPPAVRSGDVLAFGERVRARVTRVSGLSSRLVELAFDLPEDELYAALYRAGRPVQYWYHDGALEDWHVQTPFGGRPWAMEMPSAGRPLTVPLLLELRRRGVALASITHAAGLSATGDEALDRALPLPELTDVSGTAVRAIRAARAAGGRVIAAGTSVVRALEGAAAAAPGGPLRPMRGEVDLRVGCGFRLQVVDALLTGMHEPDESHFDLLCAFASPGVLAGATAHAEAAGYLCHEFGDSMLIAANRRGRGQ
jgi:S-adenosylmethionine:tRNA ribosyltransferase-isomerase